MTQPNREQRAGYQLRRDIEAALGVELPGKVAVAVLEACERYAVILAETALAHALARLRDRT